MPLVSGADGYQKNNLIYHSGNLTKLSQLTDDIVSGNYLPLSGGTINGILTVTNNSDTVFKINSTKSEPAILFQLNGTNIARISANPNDGYLYRTTATWDNSYKIYDSGNLTKSTLGLGNVENTALSTWAGTNKITTLGTITTGTWNGSKIANSYLANSSISISGTSVSLGGSITQSALRTALGLGSNAYTSTAYLPLTGGTLSDRLQIIHARQGASSLGLKATNNSVVFINFRTDLDATEIDLGDLGVTTNKELVFYNSGWKKVWHEGNFTPSNYLPLTGGTLTSSSHEALVINRTGGVSPYLTFNSDGATLGRIGFDVSSKDVIASIKGVIQTLIHSGNIGSYAWTSGNDGSGSGLDADMLDGLQPSELNVGSATKLQTARTIWGQSFDGTGNVSGDIKFDAGYGIWNKDTTGNYRNTLYFNTNNLLSVGLGTSGQGYNTDIYGNNIQMRYGTSQSLGLILNSSGNVGIGTTSPSEKLHVAGNILATGTITQQSQRDLKDIIDEKVLSLDDMSTIKPTRFKWKDGRDEDVHYGGIAEDIQQVIPEVVHKSEDNLTVEYNTAAFVMVASLVEHVKELTQRISSLEKECEQLRNAIV